MSCNHEFPNVDLHAHSTASDGALSARELVQRARRQRLDLFALTDHDSVEGLAQARNTADEIGQRFIPGIEISVTWAGETVHIVGLAVDPEHADLRDGIESVRAGRIERGEEMGRLLEAVGIEGAFNGALAFAENPLMLSRTHFARYIVARGHCADTREVFRRYMVDGKPGYVPHRWGKLADAVQWIHGAGGIAVVAHPGRYKFNDLQFDQLFTEFKQLGGEAVEVVTSNHGAHDVKRFARLAQDYGFEASRGSDFHSPNEGDIELGRIATLPAGLRPVWDRYL